MMATGRGTNYSPSLAAGIGDAGTPGSESPQQHTEVELNYVRSGEMGLARSGMDVTVESGQLAVFWGGFCTRIIRSTGPVSYCWVRIPLETVLRWHLPIEFKQVILSGRVLVDKPDGRGSLDLALFESWVHESGRSKNGNSIWTLLEIEARLGRMAQSLPTASGRDLSKRGVIPEAHTVAASRIALFLSQHYAEPVYWKDVAELVGVSVSSAQKCFQLIYGMTLHQYLLHLRLARAKQMIADNSAKIIDIALESGFPTVSNFYRSFEAAVGQTPSAYRKSLG